MPLPRLGRLRPTATHPPTTSLFNNGSNLIPCSSHCLPPQITTKSNDQQSIAYHLDATSGRDADDHTMVSKIDRGHLLTDYILRNSIDSPSLSLPLPLLSSGPPYPAPRSLLRPLLSLHLHQDSPTSTISRSANEGTMVATRAGASSPVTPCVG